MSVTKLIKRHRQLVRRIELVGKIYDKGNSTIFHKYFRVLNIIKTEMESVNAQINQIAITTKSIREIERIEKFWGI